VKREKIRVLHVHGTGSLPLVIFATTGLRRRVKVCFTWQDSESVLSETGWRRRILIAALRRCASVSGSCQRVADKLRADAVLGHVGVFHGGVPETSAVPYRELIFPSVLWLGRMVPPKDPQSLVRAAAALRAEGLKFKVDLLGGPDRRTQWYFDQTRALIKALGADEYVLMPGFVPDEAMHAVVANAQSAVQTSHTEGMSIALMEQMMAGLAIVATDVGDTSKAIRHDDTGLLIPSHDDGSLTTALRRLLTDVDLCRRLAMAAHEEAVRTFSLRAMTCRALSEYQRTLREGVGNG